MFSGGDVVGWDRNLLEGLGVRQEVARHAQNNDKLRRVLGSRGLKEPSRTNYFNPKPLLTQNAPLASLLFFEICLIVPVKVPNILLSMKRLRHVRQVVARSQVEG